MPNICLSEGERERDLHNIRLVALDGISFLSRGCVMDGEHLQLEGVWMSMCFLYPHSHCHMVKHSKLVLPFRVSHRDDMVRGHNAPYVDSIDHGIAMGPIETMIT